MPVQMRLDISHDFGEGVDPGAVGDMSEAIIAVNEDSFYADTPGAEDIHVILVAYIYSLLRLGMGLIQRSQKYLWSWLIVTASVSTGPIESPSDSGKGSVTITRSSLRRRKQECPSQVISTLSPLMECRRSPYRTRRPMRHRNGYGCRFATSQRMIW